MIKDLDLVDSNMCYALSMCVYDIQIKYQKEAKVLLTT